MTIRYLDTHYLTKAWVGASGDHARHQAKSFTYRVRPHLRSGRRAGGRVVALVTLSWARSLHVLAPGPASQGGPARGLPT